MIAFTCTVLNYYVLDGTKLQQTDPPSVAIADLFPDGGPVGEIQEYPVAQDRFVGFFFQFESALGSFA